jgi:integrase
LLTDLVEDYLEQRRGVGYKLVTVGRLLRSFAQFASRNGPVAVIDVTTSIEWASLAPAPASRERRLQVVERFSRHARIEDPRHAVLPVDAFGRHPSKRRPHIYSPDEVRAILTAASRLRPTGSIRPHTYVTLLGLLRSTGLRVSEALALRVNDIGTSGLQVLETKFHKSRLVPLHETTAAALQRYLDRRRRVPSSTDHVFVTLAGQALKYPTVCRAFSEIRREAFKGVVPRPLPRIHDLRHTFAVRALEGAPTRTLLVGRHMRALSTYMGHVSIVSTYWYLRATPHLMTGIADACETFLEGEPR